MAKLKSKFRIRRLRNRFTGVEWYTRQPVEWRVPPGVHNIDVDKDELARAQAGYEYASTDNPDPTKVDPLWREPDWSHPPAPAPRAEAHSFVVELESMLERLQQIHSESISWGTIPDWPVGHAWQHNDYLRQLDTGRSMLGAAVASTEDWNSAWPPNASTAPAQPAPGGGQVLPIPLRSVVCVHPDHALAAAFPKGMVLLGVMAPEGARGELTALVTYESWAGPAQLPLNALIAYLP